MSSGLNVNLRAGTPSDAPALAKICFDAFHDVSSKQNFESPITPEIANGAVGCSLTVPGFYSVVAEVGGKAVGSNFSDERGPIVGVGPISVDPSVMNSGIGRALMQNVVDRALAQKRAGIRLATQAYQGRSMSLYSSIGFKIREFLLCFQGPAATLHVPSACRVRAAQASDLAAITRLCVKVFGHDREEEALSAIQRGCGALVAEKDGVITGFTSGIGFFGYTVCESNDDMKALIAGAGAYAGQGFLLPATNHEIVTWCLANKLRVVASYVYMSIGLYNDPQGPWMPNITY